MRKIINYLLPLLFLLGITSSCQREQAVEPQTATLQISKQDLQFGKELGVEQIEVKSNVAWEAVIASPESNWLKLEQDASQLILKAEANDSGVERRAKVLVVASGRTAEVSVRQSTSEAVLSLKGGELTLNSQGGKTVVELEGNDRKWSLKTLESNVDWLSVEPLPSAGMLVLTSKRNPSEEERTTTLKIQLSSGNELPVEVRQAGQLTYFLPYEGNRKDLNFYDLIDHERKRGFALGMFVLSSETWLGSTPDLLEFHTFSSKLPKLVYTRPHEHEHRLIADKIAVTLSDVKEVYKGGGYREWLLQRGFKEAYGSTDTEPFLESEDGYYQVKLSINKDTGVASLNFFPQLLQERPYPTFPNFPFGTDDILSRIKNPLWKFTETNAWHVSRGDSLVFSQKNPYGKTDEEKAKYALLIYRSNKTAEAVATPDFYYYQLLFTTGRRTDPEPEVVETASTINFCYTNHNLVIFLTDNKNHFKVTQEFRRLAESAGFVYKGISGGKISFTHQERQLKLSVQMVIEKALFGVDHTALLTFERMDPPTGTNSTTRSVTSPAAIASPRTSLLK